VASIAFCEVVPAVDGNVKRILARLFDLPSPTPGELRALATELVDPHRPGDFNQALMELGALVCTPRNPRCGKCPIQGECLALERGTVAERPAPREKKKVPEVDVAVLVAVAVPNGGATSGEEPRFLLRKRPAQGLLAGMWEFPGVDIAKDPSAESARGIVIGFVEALGLSSIGQYPQPMDPVIHVFSHLKCTYRPALLQVSSTPIRPARSGESQDEATTWKWVAPEELQGTPLPVAQQKIFRAALEILGER
jgi:A/G-specific adenine glycosylase